MVDQKKQQESAKENDTEIRWQLLERRSALSRELRRLCDQQPSEDCDVIAEKTGLMAKILEAQEAYRKFESR